MPTYEYECQSCGYRFEARQGINDPVLGECPECRGQVRRLISGGAGFILKGNVPGPARRQGESCSWEQRGRTCCGQTQRCDRPPCGGD